MKIEDVLNNIKIKIGNRYNFQQWFEKIRKDEIYLISDLKDIESFYTDYMKNHNLNPKEYRAMAFSSAWIILHENNETLDSMSWLLIHELGHRWTKKIRDLLGYDLLEAMSGGSLGSLSKEDYQAYLTDDYVHEARYEEQFVNQIANEIMGFAYDRHWWRKNCYIKEETK